MQQNNLDFEELEERRVCKQHQKTIIRACVFRNCNQTQPFGCIDCFKSKHKHQPTTADKCFKHNSSIFFVCTDPTCKRSNKDGCSQCMSKFHNHQNSQICDKHQEKFSKLCMSKECEQLSCLCCEQCIKQTHNHKKQCIIEIKFFKQLFTKVVELKQINEQLRFQKTRFRGLLSEYVQDITKHFFQNMGFMNKKIENLIRNFYFYQKEKVQFRQIINLVSQNRFEEIKPTELNDFYEVINKKKNDNFTLYEVRKYCEYLILIKKEVNEFNLSYNLLMNSKIIQNFGNNIKPPTETFQQINKFFDSQMDKWNLKQYSKFDLDDQFLDIQKLKFKDNKDYKHIEKNDVRIQDSFVDHIPPIVNQVSKKKDTQKQMEVQIKAKHFQKVEQVKAQKEHQNQQNQFNQLYAKGGQYYNQSNFEKAIQYYKKAIQIKPNQYKTYNSLGVALYSLQKYQQAIWNYEKALSLNPKYSYAYNNKGNALSQMGKLKEAIINYNKAIQLNPHDAGAYNGKGIAFYGLGKYKEAIEYYDKAIQFQNRYANAYNNKANTLYTLGRFHESILCYDKAIQFDPKQKLYYNNKVNALQRLGKYTEAKILRQSIQRI